MSVISSSEFVLEGSAIFFIEGKEMVNIVQRKYPSPYKSCLFSHIKWHFTQEVKVTKYSMKSWSLVIAVALQIINYIFVLPSSSKRASGSSVL